MTIRPDPRRTTITSDSGFFISLQIRVVRDTWRCPINAHTWDASCPGRRTLSSGTRGPARSSGDGFDVPATTPPLTKWEYVSTAQHLVRWTVTTSNWVPDGRSS